MDTLEKFSGPIDGRDDEEMSKILADLESAVDGLGITFRVVPFDTPTVCVYGPYETPIGTLMWMTDSIDEPEVYQWWSVCSLPNVGTRLSKHGDAVREALAMLINLYIDRKIGLA